MSFYSLPDSFSFEKLPVSLIVVPLKIIYIFSLTAFKIFCLFSPFSNLTTMCPGVVSFYLFLGFAELLEAVAWWLLLVWKNSWPVSLQILLLPLHILSLLSCWDSNYIYMRPFQWVLYGSHTLVDIFQTLTSVSIRELSTDLPVH